MKVCKGLIIQGYWEKTTGQRKPSRELDSLIHPHPKSMSGLRKEQKSQ
jgi:hypothetical protein